MNHTHAANGEAAIVNENQSMSLSDVVTRLSEERNSREDVVLNTRDHLTMIPTEDGSDVEVGFVGDGEVSNRLLGERLPATEWAHSQIASKAGIPSKYYNRMRTEAPALLADNVSHWWDTEPENRMVRAVGVNGTSRIRAFLSTRFQILDNLDFVTRVFSAAEEFDAQARNCHITDDRLHVQLLTPRKREIPSRTGDVVQQGITIRNSEVGDGRIVVQPWVFRLVCSNGMLSTQQFRRTHLGSKQEVGILSASTIAKQADATWSEVTDWVKWSLDAAHFDEMVATLDRAATTTVIATARDATANITRDFNLSRQEGLAVLERYLRMADETQYGIAQAVTHVAHEMAAVGTFQRRVELESIGGNIVDTSPDKFSSRVNRAVTAKDMEKVLGIQAA